jgi:hypothetical protein
MAMRIYGYMMSNADDIASLDLTREYKRNDRIALIKSEKGWIGAD